MSQLPPGGHREWSVQEVARLAGTTSRTLRHYDAVGLLAPSRIGPNGYRYYNQAALIRLQRILLLRELGLGLDAIARVLERDSDAAAALRTHLDWLQKDRERLARQITAVQRTITALEEGKPIMADEVFEGFDHSDYKEEVEQRWGKEAYASSARWWRNMDDDERSQWRAETEALGRAWTEAAAQGTDPTGPVAQGLAARHLDWLKAGPGAPTDPENLAGYVRGLADMYVADPRFAANYGGTDGAGFVRSALLAYTERELKG